MSVPLRVVSVPVDAMTETNGVYVNPQEWNPKADSRFVLIRQVPFTLMKDPQVVVGTIAMNAIQRRAAGITTATGDTVDLAQAALPTPTAVITVAELDIEYISASKKGGVIDAKQFTDYFLNKFAGQCFIEGQLVAVILDSQQKYIARFKRLEAMVKGTAEPSPMGILQPETLITLSTKEKCEIQLINLTDKQIDTQQQDLINPFNLEKLGIGGLRAEFGQVFRRAFASRIFPKSLVKKLGIKHVKGVLLYGPPGTGKTLIARKIGEILNCKPPKIVSGPELFNKFVGQTEQNVRDLFKEAEADQLSKGDQSPLHLLIFDEFDALVKQRGAVRDGTGVGDNVVNQLLAKIDGVNALNNVLLIGMTNRKDLIDDAILRPGRFEVLVEIGLPDEHGRVEIFRIHTKSMHDNGILDPDVSLERLAEQTKNFSGAEIEGVVKAAVSHALSRHVDFENPSLTIDPSSITVSSQDFQKALKDITPAFGQAKDELGAMCRNGIADYGPVWKHIKKQCDGFVTHVRESPKIHLMSVLIEGCVGCGKSAIASYMALGSGFPYVKLVSADTLVGYGENQKSNIIRKAFEDAYKSNLSIIVLDDLERLIEYSHLGARYSNVLLQTLLVLLKRTPPEGKKLLVLGTTSLLDVMESLEVANCFSVTLSVPTLDPNALGPVLASMGLQCPDLDDCLTAMPAHIPMKKLMLVCEMAAQEAGSNPDGTPKRIVTYESFSAALVAANVR